MYILESKAGFRRGGLLLSYLSAIWKQNHKNHPSLAKKVGQLFSYPRVFEFMTVSAEPKKIYPSSHSQKSFLFFPQLFLFLVGEKDWMNFNFQVGREMKTFAFLAWTPDKSEKALPGLLPSSIPPLGNLIIVWKKEKKSGCLGNCRVDNYARVFRVPNKSCWQPGRYTHSGFRIFPQCNSAILGLHMYYMPVFGNSSNFSAFMAFFQSIGQTTLLKIIFAAFGLSIDFPT